ncbi:GroES-like protein [Daldinia caldariorum]|uniref:GroES-like protein n=1 Tax=Daldinia caldariorum TaxID=326644 RepID=UPI0020079E0D|nr:GroES-like protein [Daldinia caldariorum]KAI1463570.1 GroES-like protein [Daldinia caldariorum]
MKEVIIQPSLDAFEVIESPIPTPKDKFIVIKVVVSGSNPKDWKHPYWNGTPFNTGDDIAGIVHSVGKDVYEFKPGDRVCAYHEAMNVNGSFAEYATAPDWATFHLPHNVSFEEAATIPTAAYTAVVALYIELKLPAPFDLRGFPEGKKVPLLIYGVTSACGAFAAKLARLSGIGPIIGVAGRATDFAMTLADHVLDYRKGEDALVAGVQEILAKEGLGDKVPYVFDAISEGESFEVASRVVDQNGGRITTVLPYQFFANARENFRFPDGVEASNTVVLRVFTTHKDVGYIWSRYFGRLLEAGKLKGHPYEVIPGGLNGVLIGLNKLKDGQASGLKYVYKIEESGDVTTGLHKLDPALVSHKNARKVEEFFKFKFPSE